MVGNFEKRDLQIVLFCVCFVFFGAKFYLKVKKNYFFLEKKQQNLICRKKLLTIYNKNPIDYC